MAGGADPDLLAQGLLVEPDQHLGACPAHGGGGAGVQGGLARPARPRCAARGCDVRRGHRGGETPRRRCAGSRRPARAPRRTRPWSRPGSGSATPGGGLGPVEVGHRGGVVELGEPGAAPSAERDRVQAGCGGQQLGLQGAAGLAGEVRQGPVEPRTCGSPILPCAYSAAAPESCLRRRPVASSRLASPGVMVRSSASCRCDSRRARDPARRSSGRSARARAASGPPPRSPASCAAPRAAADCRAPSPAAGAAASRPAAPYPGRPQTRHRPRGPRAHREARRPHRWSSLAPPSGSRQPTDQPTVERVFESTSACDTLVRGSPRGGGQPRCGPSPTWRGLPGRLQPGVAVRPRD